VRGLRREGRLGDGVVSGAQLFELGAQPFDRPLLHAHDGAELLDRVALVRVANFELGDALFEGHGRRAR
jgi:hypothetical protein